MRNETLLEMLEEVEKEVYNATEFTSPALDVLIEEVKHRIRENQIIRVIFEWTQKSKILNFMQVHPWRSVSAICFNDTKRYAWFPFVGYSSNSRLAELYKAGLIDNTWYSTFNWRTVNLYRITEKWMKFKIRPKKSV